MKTSKVYVPHVPTRYNPLDGTRVPTVDLNPAAQFGTLVQLTSPHVGTLTQANMWSAIEEIHNAISDITEDDYIVAVGDPILVAAAIAYASDTNGKTNVLRWDRHSRTYIALEVTL